MRKIIESVEYDTEDGRVLLIYTYELKINLWCCIGNYEICYNYVDEQLNYLISLGVIYISKETCEKAEKLMTENIKFKNNILRKSYKLIKE